MKKIALLFILTALLFSCATDDPKVDPTQSDPTDEAPTDEFPTDDDDDAAQPPVSGPITAPCESGLAGSYYPCSGFDLVYQIPLEDFEADSGNDSWGWTDPDTGKEYVIMGLDNGTAFIDISDIEDIQILGVLATETSSSAWRDIKVYQNYAYIVSEASGHGMQVFDLTKLRNSGTGNSFSPDNVYDGFGSAHNIVINEESGFAYAVGTITYNGGPHFIDLADPLNPVAAGGYQMGAYSHDAQVVTYNGPDTEHVGKEILIGSNVNEVVIVDISNKNNPIQLSTIGYGQTEYAHQGWFTEDHAYFLLGDELDEPAYGFTTRTIVFDFTDLDNPELKVEYFGPTPAIDHNGYVKGDRYYLANYTAGMRVIDISDIANGNMIEVGYFDTHILFDIAAFRGAWNVYPYFESGHIVISDMNYGLFIVKKK